MIAHAKAFYEMRLDRFSHELPLTRVALGDSALEQRASESDSRFCVDLMARKMAVLFRRHSPNFERE